MKKITYLFIAVFISITAFAQTEITDDLNFTGTGHEIKKALIETVSSLGAETPTAGRFVRVSNGSVYVGNGSSWERAVFVLGSPTLGTVTAGTAQAQILKATGDGVGNGVFIGTDGQIYRYSADVLATADSIISATHAVFGDVVIGNAKNQKQVFRGDNNYYIANAAVYSNTTVAGYSGILRIETPINVTGFAYYMPDIVLRGYSYEYKSDFRYSIHFYWYNGTSFINTSCNTEGACPTNVINIGMKNNRITIAIGTSSTYWGIFSAYVDINSKSYATAAKDTDFESTYKIRMTTSNSDLSTVATISALNVHGVDYQGRVIGKMTPITSGYVLDVSGAAYVSGTIYGGGLISGGTLQDRTAGAKDDSLSDVNKWDVTGEEIDHNSLGDCAVDVKEIKTGYEIKDKAGNIYNTLEEKVVPVKGSKETDIQALSEMAEQLKAGVAELSAQYQVKEVTKVVESKGRNISKTVSTLSRAIQQLSERLDALESSGIKSEANSLLQNK